MKLYIVRHGQTDWNKKKMLQGQNNIPLNNTGRNEAMEVATTLVHYKIDRIISSTLERAYETAQIINQTLKKPLNTDERLIERGFGDYEGHIYDQAIIEQFWEVNFTSGNIEAFPNVFERVKEFILTLQNKDETILIVCHGIIAAMIKYLLDDNITDMYNLTPHNCEILAYEFDDWSKIKSRNF